MNAERCGIGGSGMNGKVVNRVLLTNDDGIEGEGLAILEAAAQEIANEVWVVAPEHDQSGTSSSISLHNPLRVTQRGERRWSVMGTPSDCTIIAVRHLMADTPPDLVLSGVNRGANLGDDVVYSGTVGAAMTASFLGLPALALSQTFRSRTEIHWEVAAHWTPILLRDLAAGGWPGGACYTVNFPDVPLSEVSGVLASRQGR